MVPLSLFKYKYDELTQPQQNFMYKYIGGTHHHILNDPETHLTSYRLGRKVRPQNEFKLMHGVHLHLVLSYNTYSSASIFLLYPGIFLGGKGWPVHKVENLTAFCEPII
jgi:hypothetical protein